MNILVRMPNWLGDCVMATPILKQLRHYYPDAEIKIMCQKNVAGLLTHDPHINEIISFKKPNRWIHRKEHYDIIEPLRREKFDLGILLTNSFSSAWWFWRGNVKRRIGFKDNWRSWLLTDAIPYPKNIESQHLVLTYQALLAPLNIPTEPIGPQLYITEEEKQHAKKLLSTFGFDSNKQKLIGINPGAAYGSAKCWLPERFTELTKRLNEDPSIFVVYFGDSAGASLVDGITKGFSDRVINLANKTNLRELISLISLCDVFLTNDSGPMHIAAALGTPLVALFGSTSDIKTGPYGKGPITVIHKRVECSPCYKRTCPIDFKCMKRIEVNEVYNAIQSQLK